jgi:hypothetical protein
VARRTRGKEIIGRLGCHGEFQSLKSTTNLEDRAMAELELDRAADVILQDFRERFTPEILDAMFAKTSILSPSFGRTNYLPRVLRESKACYANFDELMTACATAGLSVDRRVAFHMGIMLGFLVAEDVARGMTASRQSFGDGGSERVEDSAAV